jgi:hypothetical protein
MVLKFFILSGKKVKQFDSASQVDEFIKNNKFHPSDKIIMKDKYNNIIGSMFIKKYLKYGN